MSQDFFSWLEQYVGKDALQSSFQVTARQLGHMLLDGKARGEWLNGYLESMVNDAPRPMAVLADGTVAPHVLMTWVEGFLEHYNHQDAQTVESLIDRIQSLVEQPHQALTLMDAAFLAYAFNTPHMKASQMSIVRQSSLPVGDLSQSLDMLAKASIAWIEAHDELAADRYVESKMRPYVLCRQPGNEFNMIAAANAAHDAAAELNEHDYSSLARDYRTIIECSNATDIRERIRFELDHLAAGDLLPPTRSTAA
ncbi:hypothetical protein GC177_02295 [bacterium]|nr:hypothetical protein [bacterium]